MPSNSLLVHHKTCHEDINRQQASPAPDAGDRTFTTLNTLQRRQLSDFMGLPCAQTRIQLTALLVALFVFKSCDTGMQSLQQKWQRLTLSTTLATIAFFSVNMYQEARL